MFDVIETQKREPRGVCKDSHSTAFLLCLVLIKSKVSVVAVAAALSFEAVYGLFLLYQRVVCRTYVK